MEEIGSKYYMTKNQLKRLRKKKTKMEDNSIPQHRKTKRITKKNQVVTCNQCGEQKKRRDTMFVLHEKTHERYCFKCLKVE